MVHKALLDVVQSIAHDHWPCEPSMLKPLDFSPIKNLCKVSHNLYYHKHIIMLITLIRARFIDLPKWVLRIRDKSLFCSDLGVCNTLFISFEHTYKITKFRGSSQI